MIQLPTVLDLQHAAEASAATLKRIAVEADPRLVWAIPLLPVLGFLFQTFVGRKAPKPIVSAVSLAVIFVPAIIAWILFFKLKGGGDAGAVKFIDADLGAWIHVPGVDKTDGWMSVLVNHRLVVDQLTSVMILVVTNIAFLIHLYSTGYMADEKRYARYFSYLNLFTGFMLILVMGSSLLLMFVGWEGVGLCSYLLIGFWFEKKENAAAGMKAFVVNRVGDFAFTIGVMVLFVSLGTWYGVWTVDFDRIREVVTAHSDEIATSGLATVVGILFFIGATGKSAQIPLYTWLPDAMAGPTPVSALIHAATMVTAGVYMIARTSFLYALSPTAMAVVACTGAATALFAGTIGLVQNDIKKVLAYSTVSQLGFMFLAVGVGAFAAGVFHLFTHAFFKACLFLGSGSVIHGMGGEQDIRKMGGLRKVMPITWITFLISTLAIAGIPPFAGFFSKDEILWQTATTHALGGLSWLRFVLYPMGVAAAACTAFYMFRLVYKTFDGQPQWAHRPAFSGGGAGHGHEDDESLGNVEPLPDDASLLDMGKLGGHGHAAHDAPAAHGHDAGHGHGGHGHHGEPHESPPSMTVPLALLAGAAVVVGFLGLPHVIGHNLFADWLSPVVNPWHLEKQVHGPAWLEWLLMGLSTAVAVGSILLARSIYKKRSGVPAKDLAEKHPELYKLMLDKYRVDELYDRTVVQPVLSLNESAAVFDGTVVDGAVNGAAALVRGSSKGVGVFDNNVVDGAVNATAVATQEAGRRVRRLQTGNIREYLTFALVGALAVIAIFCLLIMLRVV